MNLLGAKLYDPGTAAGLGTVASAMAVFDTTNARISFVVPPSGMVRVVIQCTVHGATTFSQILLGVMEGATVKGKVAPVGSMNGTALATTLMTQTADFVVPGLVAGASLTWDAAWGIETFVTASLIKYGGPANATVNNDFGALIFQIWDPCPIYTPTSATAPATTVSARIDTLQTAVTAIKTVTDKFVFTIANKVDSSIQLAADFAQAAADKVWLTAARALTDKAGFALSANGVQAIWDALTSALTTVGSIGKLLVDRIDAAITSRMATFAYTTPPTVALIRAEMDTNSTKLDVAVGTRMATFVYTAPDNSTTATDAIMARLGAPAGASLSADVAAVKVDSAAVKVQTDKLVFTVANKLDVNVLVVNGVVVIGTGAVGDRFRAFGT